MNKQLTQLFEEFVDECHYGRRLRPQTIKGYQQVFDHFTRTMSEVTRPAEINQATLIEFFKRIQTRIRIVGKGKEVEGVKDSTIHTYASKLNTFFEWLRIKGEIEDNPVAQLNLQYPQYTDIRKLSKSEIQKIYTAIQLHSKDSYMANRNRAIISTFLFAGIRRGELLGLQVTDVDLQKRELTVRAETSKSKRTRIIPICPELMRDLENYLMMRKERGDKSEFLYVSGNKDSGLTQHGLKHLVKKLSQQSGVKFHVHRFRHSFACALVKSGASAIKVQKILGHTDLRMTQAYLRSLGADEYREDMSKLSIEQFV